MAIKADKANSDARALLQRLKFMGILSSIEALCASYGPS
jgi:hypothetical protein